MKLAVGRYNGGAMTWGFLLGERRSKAEEFGRSVSVVIIYVYIMIPS